MILVPENSICFDGDIYSLTVTRSGMTEWWLIRMLMKMMIKKMMMIMMAVKTFSHRKELRHDRVVGDQGGEGGVVLQETLRILIGIFIIIIDCHRFIIHLNFVSRFVSDNNVVGDTLWMETLRHPEKQILTLRSKY